MQLPTAAEVMAKAETEGLQLVIAPGTESGYKHVITVYGRKRQQSFVVKTCTKGIQKQRSRPFPIAEQAALYLARISRREADEQAAAVEAAGQQSMAGLLAAAAVAGEE